MTVAELITELQKHKPDAGVIVMVENRSRRADEVFALKNAPQIVIADTRRLPCGVGGQ